MKVEGDPSKNVLALAGFITNEAGRVFEPPCGPLHLSWLFEVSREATRLAKESFSLSQKRTVRDEVRYGWFIASTEAEFAGFKFLLKEDWRRALQSWKGGGVFALHNRATLHRALSYSKDSQKPDAHIRECLRLYHHLSELVPKQTTYRLFQDELTEMLKGSIEACHQSGDDESAARSLKILAKTVGILAVEHFQEQLFSAELKSFRVGCARLQKELLVYQGLAHAPPVDLLERCDNELSKTLIPQAASFSSTLVEGSKERNEVERLLAEVCGILSQTYSKAEDARGAKRWLGEAMRWEPSAVKNWKSLPDENFGEEESAVVAFPEKKEDISVAPRPMGSPLFGIQAKLTQQEEGVSREEWLESIYSLFLPIFPLRRFAAYRNLDKGEIGYYLPLPLTFLDHVRQGVFVLLLSFVVTIGAVSCKNYLGQNESRGGSVSRQEISQEIDSVVEELKDLAQQESRLAGLSAPSVEQEEEMKGVQLKRGRLIQRLQELEKMRKE